MTTLQPLSLFISSKMEELVPELRAVQGVLSTYLMKGWLWGKNVVTHPESIHSIYLAQMMASGDEEAYRTEQDALPDYEPIRFEPDMQARLKFSSDDAEHRFARNAEVRQALQVLLHFWYADWQTRLHMLKKHEQLLLDESVELLFPLFQKVLEKDTGSAVVAQQSAERLGTLLHYCRTWGIGPGWFFAAYMLLEDNIDIPVQYEDSIQQIAMLLSLQKEDITVQAVEMMLALLDRLTADTPILFEAALLCDLATELSSLPYSHPARVPEQIVAYYREALPYYQATERLHTVVFIQRLLATALREQRDYNEALEVLQSATQTLLANKLRNGDAAWTFSDYADTLYKVGHLEESLEAYNLALALLPGEPTLFYNRAEKLILARRLDEAIADLEQALTLNDNENNPYIWLRRTQLAIAEGDGSQVEQMLQEALKQDAYLDATLLHAQGAWLRGDMSTACEKLQQAWKRAHLADREVIRREIVCLLNEHPYLPGSDEMIAIMVIQR